eukprot:CAMPEP_0185573812 /NCGR_PEP_ID=MMETSP0434-20130131/5420_1 /TAXON_ID=626734 ORGANISM="Favella taraikaensis, Strain Fe Narragansett Bay" /NCGR_SAMPLE_ID=MMETSP0434 /ASSEMBLY_ACC=CAM_ASM_000379 /LENGTH=103 /DNA_ID=CAMNT_0028190161 /DNA_START=445 /DNA_END=756 /DNA_ORIENTATION=+
MLYLLNEYLYLTCAFLMLGFTAYTVQPETRYDNGWVYTGFLGAILAVNVFIMLFDVCISAKTALKRCKLRKQAEVAREKRQVEAAQHRNQILAEQRKKKAEQD